MKAVLAALGLLLFLGCPERRHGAPAAPAVAPPVTDGGSGSAEALLARWLEYHRLLRETVPGDAGVEARARAERSVRQQVSLSEAELDSIEGCVASVVSARAIAKLTGAEALRDFDRAVAGASAEQRAKIDQAFGELRARSKSVSLEAERAAWGDAAVDAVLAREAQVTETWDRLVDARGDAR